MLYAEEEKKLRVAKHLLDSADSENIIERCKQYLVLLDEYRTRLYELGTVRSRSESTKTSTGNKLPDRSVIRIAIEETTSERNRTKALLLSFTTVSGYEAVDLFNERFYRGHEDWELRASGIKFPGGGDSDLMTIQEAVDLASLLRREDHTSRRSTTR
jgi:hypothetical protein